MMVSFFFIAPGLLLRLLCLILAVHVSAPSASSLAGTSGKASTSDSRLATSFLDGRLRFLLALFDFSIRETSAACLIVRLSFFDVPNALPELACVGACVVPKAELVLGLRVRRDKRLPLTSA